MPFMTYITRRTTTTTTTKLPSKELHKRTQNNTRKRREIGDYYLGKTIGRGASGRVKLGYHRHTGEQVAIKVISRNLLATSSSMAKCVQRELAVLQLLHHPHLVDLRQVLQDSSNVYFVMEYMEGGELFQVLSERGKLPEKEARSLFRQLTEALSWCHAHHICHRDLKPENILLDKDHKTLKLADFGMATIYKPDTMLQTSCGSPHYASPEVVRGKHYHGPATDIWSCGVILYAMLAGHLPFDDDNISRLLVKIKSGRYIPLPSSVSPEAKDLVKSMLVVDPVKRINLESVLVHPWLTNHSFLGTDLRFPDTLSLYDRPRDFVGDLDLERPVISNASDIDGRIWETLKVLWRDCTQNELISALTSNESNIPKITCRLLQQRAWRQEQQDQQAQTQTLRKTSQSFSPLSEESASYIAAPPMTPPLTPHTTNNNGSSCCKHHHHHGYSKSSISNLPPTPCDSTIDTIACTTYVYESPTPLKSIPAFDFDISWHSDMNGELNELLKKRPCLVGENTNIDPCEASPGAQTKSHRSGSIGSSSSSSSTDTSSSSGSRSPPNSPLLLLNRHHWSPSCNNSSNSSSSSFTAADGLSSPVPPIVSGTTHVHGALIRTPLPYMQLLHRRMSADSSSAAEQEYAAGSQASFSLISRCFDAARAWYKSITTTKTSSRVKTFHRKVKHECEAAGKFHQVLEQHFNGKLSGRIYPNGQIVWNGSMVLSQDASSSSSSSYKRHQLHFICHITPFYPSTACNETVRVTLVLKQGDPSYIDEAVDRILHIWDTLESDAKEISQANGWLH